jgi:outer membrane lipoprotein-sorting protein
MKKMSAFLSVLFLISMIPVQSQNLDDILKEHFSASGQDKLIKLKTQKLTGKMIQSGIEIPIIQMAKRPNKMRMEGTFQSLTFIQTYNGKEGWSINPFAGVAEPQPMTADELRSMSNQADMDGMLWDWKGKGYTVTSEGKEDMEGTSCFKIKLVTKEGDSYIYYIDTDSYIMIRSTTKTKVMGNETEADTYYSNYTQVDGLAVPGKIETKMNGQLMMTLVIEKVEFDTDLNDSLFEKPVK